MPLITITDFGGGIVSDLAYSQSPPNALSNVTNMRYRDGEMELLLGEGDFTVAPPITPIHVMPVVIGTANYWLYAGNTKAYVTNGSTHTNLTRQTTGVDVNYAADYTKGWNGGVLNGIPVINNGVDPPQMWNPVSLTQRMQALTAWPANTLCKAIAPFGTYLIAMNITKSGTNYPHMVKWSHSADVGAAPNSWDETDPTKDAGENDLPGDDPIVGGMALGDLFVVYKTNSTHVMRYVGAPYVFSFSQILSESGAMNPKSMAQLGRSHVVLTQSDLILHNGSGAVERSIFDKRMRRWFFARLDEQYSDKCFLVQNPFFSEMMVCFPEVGSSTCTHAVVWNWRDDVLSVRELRDVHHAAMGYVTASGASDWNSDLESWYMDVTGWNKDAPVPARERVVLARDLPHLSVIDNGALIDGAPVAGFIERIGLPAGPRGQRFLLKSIRPRINAPVGTVLKIRGGASERIGNDVTWGAEVTYTVGTDEKADTLVSGQYLAYRIASDTAISWSIEALELEIEPLGAY